jgi:DNA-binding HxlR family transcriptional regulator
MRTQPESAPTQAPACCEHLFDVFAVLGKRWNGLIIGVLLNGPARFGELERAIPGIRGPILSQRLSELGAAGLVRRHVYEGPPVAVQYELTDAGNGLQPAVAELTRWAEKFLPAGGPG